MHIEWATWVNKYHLGDVFQVVSTLAVFAIIFLKGYERGHNKWAADWDATADRVAKRLKAQGIVIKDEPGVQAELLKQFEEMQTPDSRRRIH